MCRIKYISVIIVLLLLLNACNNKIDSFNILSSSEDINMMEMIDKIYTDDQLNDIVNFSGTLDELNAQYAIECIREIEDSYRIAYLGKSKIGIITFNSEGVKVFGRVYCMSPAKEAFDDIAVGQSLDDVRAIDPDGEYIFLYTGRNDTPKVSTHFTDDGYMIKITYNDLNIVANISCELV